MPLVRLWTLLVVVLIVSSCAYTTRAAQRVSARQSAAPSPVVNPDFEQGEIGQVPSGWFVPLPSQQAGYTAKLVTERPESGKRCALLSRDKEATGEAQSAFGNLMQSFDAAPYRGKRVRFRAAVRLDAAPDSSGRAQLWLRVDRKNDEMGFFDNMHDRPITAKEWRTYDIVGDVEKDAESINLGIMLFGGEGKVWIDDVSFVVLGKATPVVVEPARPLAPRGLENLVAFTRLLGYVRHFHPSDEAAATNWETFAIAGVRAVENARDATDLVQKLESLFRPIAPTVRVFPTGRHPPIPAELSPPKNVRTLQVTAWRHVGFGTGNPQSTYRSERVRKPAPYGKIPTDFPGGTQDACAPSDPAKPYEADLGGGVSCLVPLALFVDGKGTMPHPTPSKPQPTQPSSSLTGNDRATRLADVALAWNVLQHFYPYFDVVKNDWHRALRDALSSAATDSDEKAFLNTLRRLVAQLHDGHGNVIHRSDDAFFVPPFLWDWVEGHLVITHVAPDNLGNLKRGDTILTVNGRPAAEVLAEEERLSGGATPQWNRLVALRGLLLGARDSKLTLEVQRPSEKPRIVTVHRTLEYHQLTEPRPPKVHEMKPGIFYLDIDRISDEDFEKALSQLEKAVGIIFDLRGYPRNIDVTPIAHLIDQPVTSPQWHVPVMTRPDQKQVSFQFRNWTVEPKAPRLKAKVAFLTDGGAISYAETYLGIIEHYKLAEIVGGPTAGTNGNINPFTLSGGYTVIWTGMKVLKHDGSQHHGIGIQPTVCVSRTVHGVAEGRDEVLERAMEVVSH